MSEPLLPGLTGAGASRGLRIAGVEISYRDLAGAAGELGLQLRGTGTVAVMAHPTVDTVAAVVGALGAGVTIVPINPGSGERELAHIVSDCQPEAVAAPADEDLPPALGRIPRVVTTTRGAGRWQERELDPEATAMLLYTSGTTGLPKAVQIPRRAIAANLDALAEVWGWTAADRLVHGLPLYHVHGLILGLLGPLRLGSELDHVGRFSAGAVATALDRGAAMVFGVPTMYRRLAQAAEDDPAVARSLASARLLVSGSAALPAREHARIEKLTGQRIVERYGMTETLIITSTRASGERTPGSVGSALPGVDVRLVDDHGGVVQAADGETMGEVLVRGPGLFTGYLNRDDATAEAFVNGWFATGDLATRRPDGELQIVGRRSSDLIKSGGYRIGALEIEGALLEHEAVADAAVRGLPDDDLGERVAAWVVLRPGARAEAEELVEHTTRLLAAHKRPREVHFVDALPRNAMGKVLKHRLEA